jgi:hypothetical protein
MSMFPTPGSKFVSRHGGKRETRWVIDKTLGGHVVYEVGRRPRNAYRSYGLRCTLAEWHEWAKHAKETKR